MTGFNNNNNIKFVPVAPKTYEVRYVENKQSGLSPAARNKVIKMHGSDYQSLRATINSPSYGPGFWDDVVKPVGKAFGQTVGAAAIVATGPVAGTLLAAGAIAGGNAQKKATEANKDNLPGPVKEYIDFTADNSIEAGKTALKILTLNQVKIDE